jgi:transcriptional regulator with XRE-family HTH domain
MTTHDESEQRRRMELASFLRSRREKLLPEQVGLPKRARRRTPGLRREEVAEYIGISTTWYTWLEQGRAIHVSVEVVEQLAHLLRLSEDEQVYFFHLTQHPLPPMLPQPQEGVPPVLRDILTALEPSPAHIRDRQWNVLAHNRAESFLLDWSSYPASERNIVWHHFTNPAFRRLMVHWERETRSMLSEFRMESGQHTQAPWFVRLIDYLHQTSSEFREWWPLHEVRRERELPIELEHPEVGRLIFQAVTVLFTTHEHLVMRILMPMEEAETAVKLRALSKTSDK